MLILILVLIAGFISSVSVLLVLTLPNLAQEINRKKRMDYLQRNAFRSIYRSGTPMPSEQQRKENLEGTWGSLKRERDLLQKSLSGKS